ncbi:hypothetical protein ACSBR1_023376 [Camellia fascicularis]
MGLKKTVSKISSDSIPDRHRIPSLPLLIRHGNPLLQLLAPIISFLSISSLAPSSKLTAFKRFLGIINKNKTTRIKTSGSGALCSSPLVAYGVLVRLRSQPNGA